ncbi:MAG: ferredoxin [Elusimicrobia bacterium]|nr:MAG: ferredoxin [Elusimicrobiota bacterium]
MEKRSVPYERTIFVCTHTRPDGRVACANPGRGGDAICRALKAEVKARGLKGKVRVARSGCLDLCEKGPNIFFYPEKEWVGGVSEGDVPALIKRITGGN